MITMCMSLGVTSTVAYLSILFIRLIVFNTHSADDTALAQLYNNDDVMVSKKSFHYKHLLLHNVHCVADGLKKIDESVNVVIHNMFYSKRTNIHYVGTAFISTSIGKIIACTLNAPGAFRNLSIADWAGIHSKL